MLSTSLPATAKPTACKPSGPWVLASVESPAPRGLDVAEVLERLTVELSTRGLTLCTTAPASRVSIATASVSVRVPPSEPGAAATDNKPRFVRLEVEVRKDGLTKRASRDIELGAVARDSRATVVALAADELLRASADELALEQARRRIPAGRAQRSPSAAPLGPADAPSDAGPIRSGVLVDATPSPSSADRVDRLSLGVRAAGEWWTGGLALLGGDASSWLRLTPRVRFELDLGARAAFSHDAPDGSIEGQAAAARVGAAVLVTRLGSAPELALGARLGAYAVHLSGDAMAGADGTSETSGALSLELGPTMRLPFRDGRSAFVADAAFAFALRGVAARDGNTVVTGLYGGALVTSLGIVTGIL
jgi:hypothetical protein